MFSIGILRLLLVLVGCSSVGIFEPDDSFCVGGGVLFRSYFIDDVVYG